MICKDFELGKLTIKEAARNFIEIQPTSDHVQEFMDSLDHDERFDFRMEIIEIELRQK